MDDSGEEFDEPVTDFEQYGGDPRDYPIEFREAGHIDVNDEFELETREHDPDGTHVVGMGGQVYIAGSDLGVRQAETGSIGTCLGMAFEGPEAAYLAHVYVPADEVSGGENDIGTIAEDVLGTLEERVGRPFENGVLKTNVGYHGKAAAERAQAAASEYVDDLVPVYGADDGTLGVGLDEGIYAPTPREAVGGEVAPRGRERLDAPGGRILEDETAALAEEMGVDDGVPTVGDITREGRDVGDLVGSFDPGTHPHNPDSYGRGNGDRR